MRFQFRKLGVFDRKLEGSHSVFHWLFDKYQIEYTTYIKLISSSFIELTRHHNYKAYSLDHKQRSHTNKQHDGTRLGSIVPVGVYTVAGPRPLHYLVQVNPLGKQPPTQVGSPLTVLTGSHGSWVAKKIMYV